jgi:hypothetical protein
LGSTKKIEAAVRVASYGGDYANLNLMFARPEGGY